MLFSGLDIHRPPNDKSISGIARLYGVCDSLNSCLLAEGTDFSAVYIGAHEIGHGLGMLHDEPECSSDFIMSGSLGAGKTDWSTCSVKNLKNFIAKLDYYGKNCMRITSHKLSENPTQLPGQKYSANKQCSLMHGNGYKKVLATNEDEDSICRMMWCGLRNWGRIITSHPALEGTSCGHNRYCIKGQCTDDNTIVLSRVSAPENSDWSEWSSVACGDCSCPPFESSIGVVSSTRSCSYSTPENDGTDCRGDSIRGIVCKANCGPPETTLERYIEQVCAGHRNKDISNELTGKGVQLTRFESRACKIFCDVKGRSYDSKNFRFLGDLLPDGALCGDGKYCVRGRCVHFFCGDAPFICDNTTLASSIESCYRGTYGVF
ncbi:unnamed protein product [Soboliphyme baturini]|uniref:Peptidase M12B domain-containing protein n=1 Tax=Soboliphyme baturini TaxID=241478 RepID=A0A183IG34_9BILA|nr:unnamed protein product [Soboliphyme baturini]